jgi:hypothetical protein
MLEVFPCREHNGLENMRCRLESIGGKFVLETSPGNGMAIRLSVDYPHEPFRGTAKSTKNFTSIPKWQPSTSIWGGEFRLLIVA